MSLVFIPIEGERKLTQGNEYIISNYRFVQFDRGSKTSVSLPLYMIREYKLTSRSAMYKVINGIVNVIGSMPNREELRGALGLREFDNLMVGQRKKLCEVCGVPFVQPNHPYNHWISVGFHRPFSRHFYREFAWLKGEEVFTYYPDSFILTNYRLYQRDAKRRKLYIFPLHMVHTFESRKGRLRIQATTGKFEVRGKVPRQDHLVQMWQARAWDNLPTEHLDWMAKPFRYIQQRHPLTQYDVADSERVAPAPAPTETRDEMEVSADMRGGHTVFVKPVIKDRCTNCNAPLAWETIDWVGPDQYQCPSCGATHRVDYVRM